MRQYDYHTPVLTGEVIRHMNLHTNGVYVDCTVGGGGHSLAMLEKVHGIKLYCLDRDEDALRQTRRTLTSFTSQATIIKSNFKDVKTALALQKVNKVDGVLMDIGVSNHQITSPKRGFSFSIDAPLDMRMDRVTALTAKEIVNTYTYEELVKIFFNYGQEKHSKAIAKGIVQARDSQEIQTTAELSSIIEASLPPSARKITTKTKARIFQAIRIEVNDELACLGRGLSDVLSILRPGGHLVVISWHSLEDKIVKDTFHKNEGHCVCPPDLPVCQCNPKARLRSLTKRPITPSEAEIAINPNARSAKLRIAERI